jgi:beta-glucanase (GH16 family)
MFRPSLPHPWGAAAVAALVAAPFSLSAAPDKALVTLGEPAAAGIITDTPDEVSIAASEDAAHPGTVVSVTPGKSGYPGVVVEPKGGAWDLSAFGHVAATVTNLGTKDISMALRLDNSGGGPEPWNTEVTYLKGGETKTVKLIFGYSYGKAAYQLDSGRVVKMLLFTSKAKEPVSWRIESIVAGGEPGEKPPVKPESVRTAPKPGGILLGKGGLEPAMFKAGGNAASNNVADGTWKVAFNKTGQFAQLKPAQGKWDFRAGLQAVLKIKNTGTGAVLPSARLESDDKKSDKITAESPLAPGQEMDLVVPFAAASTWNSANKESGSQFSNHKATAIILSADTENEPQSLEVSSIKIGLPAAPKLPEWLGKRPPVEGDWKLTLDENFDEKQINEKVWSIYGENYWDKTTYFSKDNVILKDGMVTLRVTKKKGFHNDDPSHKRGEKEYATGFLESYGKFTQKYGYWEARTKLAVPPGVWPAFWLMPDRGGDGPQWQRADTKNGGMEFDIMEHLSGWGLYRYNIAMHWDGYDKGHKAIGTSAIYVQPDKDGFITTGLIWTPGLAVFYANGVEVGRHENERVSNVESNILFTLPMGGWDNLPMDDAQLPADFVIDYVRVWQRKDLAEK